MSSPIKCELTQKPDSPFGDPAVGQDRWFTLTEKGNFIKAKNEKADSGFGKPHKILEVERKADWNSAQHGTFHQWNLSLEALATQEDAAGAVGEAQSSSDSVSAPAAASDYAKELSPAAQARISQNVAFKGAVRVVAYEVQTGNCKPEDVPAKVESLTADLLEVLIAPSADPKDVPMDTAESVQADQTTDRLDEGQPPF